MRGLPDHLPDLLERVTVRPFAPDRALVTARLPWVNLSGLWARRGLDGHVSLSAPQVVGRDGRTWPAFALQPGAAEAIAAAVAVLWGRADAEGWW